jgi:hypothetical protein
MVRTLGIITIRLAARFFLPLVWKILVDMAKLAALSQVNYWGNVPTTMDRIANGWLAKGTQSGWPSEHEQFLFQAGRVIAFLLLLVGWILNAFLTVWIFQLFFG